MTTYEKWNRTTGVHAASYPTEADARAVLSETDQDLPYLGIWQPPDLSVTGPGLHMFSNHRNGDDLQADGWTKGDT